MSDPTTLPDGEPAAILRRGQAADSPTVGARGQKAQQRILEAALEVFGDVGYHDCGIKAITELSGYSRASFYQYFSSKEDLFRHLAGRVVQELNGAADLLDPITGDLAGWQSFHRWLTRYSQIYDAYKPVFVTFQTAAASDEMVASGAAVVADRSFHALRQKIVGASLPSGQVDGVVRTLFHTISRLNREAELLEHPGAADLDRARVNVAFADVFHRALFGPDPDVNVHPPPRSAPTRRPRPATMAPAADPADPADGPTARRTRALLVEAGHRVFVDRGFYATRVADIVAEAGVSHGSFYRYFDNKHHLFRILAARSSRQLAEALAKLPPRPADDPDAASRELRAWLQGYARSYAAEAAIFLMWQEAISRDDELPQVSAAVIDVYCRTLETYLEPRGWGDRAADALVLLVLLDGMAAGSASPASIEATARLIERGLLTGP